MLCPDDESDLRWYFSEACGGCGLKSALGAQLDIIRDGMTRGKHERHVRCDIAERVFEAAHRANRIGARLRLLDPLHEAVLRLQYEREEAAAGCDVGKSCQVEGLTVALIVGTDVAKKAYAARGTMARATTPVLWLAWLCARARHQKTTIDKASVGTLIALLSAANRLLIAAQRAYQSCQP